MNVDLPTTGCNIINSSSSFYNYSNDNHTRTNYILYDGKAIKQSVSTSTYPYTVTGDCLTTGDLVYKPELSVIFQTISLCLALFIFVVISKVLLRKWWRTLK